MGTLLNSFDNIYTADNNLGDLRRALSLTTTSASPAANSTSGYVSISRCPRQFTVPSYGATVSNSYMTNFRSAFGQNSALILCALEYNLGNISMNTGTWTNGVAMPSKIIEGVSVTTASMLTVAVATTAHTATTPAMTFTYVNEEGTGSRTCSMTLPTNATINTGYLMTPHLTNGDLAIRSISAATKSAGSAGVTTCFGLLPLGFGIVNQTGQCGCFDPLATPFPMFPIETGATIAFYIFNSTGSGDLHTFFTLEPDS